MREFGKNFYPDPTAHRLHLKGQEAAEAYLLQKQMACPHITARRAFWIFLIGFVVFQVVRWSL